MNISIKTRTITRFFLASLLCSTLSTPAFCQNLFVNGSMTAPLQQNAVPPGWTMINPTPDINSGDSMGIFLGYWYGTGVASPNGGSFVSVICFSPTAYEGFSQTVTGLVIGHTYYFSYQWAFTPFWTSSMNGGDTVISGDTTSIYINPAGPNVSVTGMSGLTNPPVASTPWNWQTVTRILTATATSATFIFKSIAPVSGATNYLSFDGISLSTSPLPVSLYAFTAIRQGQQTLLNWATASETNNSHFEVERSVNGVDFNMIGKVNGSGTTALTKEYAFTDGNPALGINYYRLKQVDIDNKSTYSKIAIVDFNDDHADNIKIYPNPVTDILHVSGMTTGQKLVVCNIFGQEVAHSATHEINMADLAAGDYYLIVQKDGQRIKVKSIIKK